MITTKAKTGTTRRLLSLLLAFILTASLLFGVMPTATFAIETPGVYQIGFTSDVHGDTGNLNNWLDKLALIGTTSLNHFIFGGDFEYNEPNCNVTAAACVLAVRTKLSVGDIYTARGNHDITDAAQFGDKGTVAITNADSSNIGYNTGLVYDGLADNAGANVDPDYAIYIMESSSQSFLNADINSLTEELDRIEGIDPSAPVFVVSHCPLHHYSRTVGNTEALLNELKNRNNVIFLWGHNHSQNDPEYGEVKSGLDDIYYYDSVSRSYKTMNDIGFIYANMGAMTDSGSNDDAYGLLATVEKYSGSCDVTFEFKNLGGATVAPSPYVVTIASSNEIDSAALTGIDQPVEGAAPDVSAVVSAGAATAGTVEWDSPAFVAGVQYTATVVLTADSGKTFAESICTADVTVNGNAATSVDRNTDGTQLTVTYLFPAALAQNTGVIYNKVENITNGKEYAVVFDGAAMTTAPASGSKEIEDTTYNYLGLSYLAPDNMSISADGKVLTIDASQASTATWTFQGADDKWTIGNAGKYANASAERTMTWSASPQTWTYGIPGTDKGTQLYVQMDSINFCLCYGQGSSIETEYQTVDFIYPSQHNVNVLALYEKADSEPEPPQDVTIYRETYELKADGKYIIAANDGTKDYAVKFQSVADTLYNVGSAEVEITDGAGYFEDDVSLGGTDIITAADDTILWEYNSDNQFKSVADSAYCLYGGKVDPATGKAGNYTVGLYAITDSVRDCIYVSSTQKIYADGSSDYYFAIASGGEFNVATSSADGDIVRIFEEIEATTGGVESETISYNANGGSGAMVGTKAAAGESVTLRANTFTKDGNNFAGWNTAANGGGTAYTDGQTFNMPEGGLTLFAQWAAAPVTIYELATSVEDGETYVIAARTGSPGSYVYKALTNSVASTSYLAATTVTVTDDCVEASGVTDTMLWTFSADAGKFDVTNGSPAQYLTRTSGEKGLTTSTTEGEAKLTDWSYGDNNLSIVGSRTYYLFYSSSDNYFANTLTDSTVPSNIYLYKLTIVAAKQTITYDANGGSGAMAGTKAAAGEPVELRANTFTKDGFTFAGWNTEADGSGALFSEGQNLNMPEDGLELFAQWTEELTSYEYAGSVEDGGTYLIVARAGSEGSYSYYALTTTTENTDYLADAAVTVTGDYVTSAVDDTMLWTFTTATSGKYDVKNGTNFLLRVTGPAGKLEIDSTDTGASYSDWAYDSSAQNFTVVSSGSGANYLYRTTSGTAYFKCSTSSGDGGTIFLYKQITVDESQTITYDANGGSGAMADTTGSTGEYVTLKENAFTKNECTFAGWNTEADGSGVAYSDKQTIEMPDGGLNLFAQWTVNKYTVTWMNGTTLETDLNVEYGETPSYDGAVPEKTATAQYSYTFNGWSPSVVSVSGDAVYTAMFTETVNEYTVTWMNGTTQLEQDLNVEYGATPDYDGAVPEKTATAQYSYTFNGWSPSVVSVSGDAVYTAMFTETVNEYTVTWKNADGTTLETDLNVEYGATPDYDGAVPEKTATAQYSYTFNGWSPVVISVSGDAVYTATFTETVNEYTVTWKNADGTTLETDLNVEYGATPSYDGAVPEKTATAQYRYTFNGWSPSVVSVSGDAVYTATFTETPVGGGTPGGGAPAGGGTSGDEDVLGAEDEAIDFDDVLEGDWYYEAIQFVVNEGLFTGITDTMFEPDSSMTRAMLVTVLYRLEGEPVTDAENPFTDVLAGMWYTEAVVWAADNGIVTGYDADTFGPGDDITREQLAAIIYRYAEFKGYDITLVDSFDIGIYTDADKISDYALAAFKWACGAELINGLTEDTVAPLDTATRAQVAEVIKRFMENIADQEIVL